MNVFHLARPNDRGVATLNVPPTYEADLAEEIRRSDFRGVDMYAAILILQERIAALEAIPRVTEVASASGKPTAGQASKPIERLGRLDRCRFGYRPDPRDNKRLVPDK